MQAPPLTLSVLHLRPSTLLLPADEPPPPPTALPADPVHPTQPLPVFSPTHSYPAPYPTTTLGSTIALSLDLANTRVNEPVKGVRMMCEIQSPNGRYRLGEIVHGSHEDENGEIVEAATMPELGVGESVKLQVDGEVKDLGLSVVIVSVAWETDDGRRTFQRFFKYNVNPPLAIKTRIHQTQHPNTSLDLVKRDEVYLEILAQNVAAEGMVFDRVYLEAVHGLVSKRVSSTANHITKTTRPPSPSTDDESEDKEDQRTLLPGETRQYLFLLSPAPPEPRTDADKDRSPHSSFPPNHAPGTILPLGRLDLTWRSGPSHDPGRLQTSTLNRRIPVVPIAPTRTLSAAPPTPGSRLNSPRPGQTGGNTATAASSASGWEFDLVMLDRPSEVDVEKPFEVKLRIGVRSRFTVESAQVEEQEEDEYADTKQDTETEKEPPRAPRPPIIAVQHLTRPVPPPLPSKNDTNGPKFLFSPPSRAGTPASTAMAPTMTRTGSAASTTTNAQSTSQRPFSPLSQMSQAPMSRPMTPVSSQLRQATASHIGSAPLSASTVPTLSINGAEAQIAAFPPAPFLSSAPAHSRANGAKAVTGQVQPIGGSLVVLPRKELDMVEEKAETTYADPIAPPRRWEAMYEHKLEFFAMDEGLADLGGLRVLLFDDEEGVAGGLGREWDSLGDVWVSG